MKKENMNNKGFSLVELIIVIAIMAILIVVLAPQYLKYVERSRNSTDLQNATELKVAVETWCADPEATSSATAEQTIILEVGTSSTTVSGTASTVGDDALNAAGLKKADIKCVSKTRWATYTMTGTMGNNGGLTWTYTNTGGSPASNTNFADAMAGKASGT